MTAQRTVGIIGLGIMGGAFAQNLVAAGWRVIGHDIDPRRRRALAKSGIEIAGNAKDLVARAPIIITSLPSPRALRDTVKAIVATRAPARIVVEASTFTLDDKIAA